MALVETIFKLRKQSEPSIYFYSSIIQTMKEIDTLPGSGQGVRCIRTGKEGPRDLLLVASTDGTISIRDIRSGLFFRSIMGHTKAPLDMQVSCFLKSVVSSKQATLVLEIHVAQ